MNSSKTNSAFIALFCLIFGFIVFAIASMSEAADDFEGFQTLAHVTTTLTNINDDFNFSKSSESFSFYPERNEIEIVHREKSPWVYPEGGGPEDKVWKEIYGVVDGKIQLIKTIYGQHHQRQITDEYIEWPEE